MAAGLLCADENALSRFFETSTGSLLRFLRDLGKDDVETIMIYTQVLARDQIESAARIARENVPWRRQLLST